MVEKIILYNLDVEIYQKLKEEKQMKLEDVAQLYKEKGISIGKERGISIGKKRGKLEIAHHLLSKGIPLELVIETTKLLKNQIMNYQKSCNL